MTIQYTYVTKYAITYFDVIEYDDIEDIPSIQPDYSDMFEITDIECNDDLLISDTYEYEYSYFT
jgi:hypothetical protein